MKVQKRDGRIVPFDAGKIRAAMEKANRAVEEKERVETRLIEETIRHVEEKAKDVVAVETIQDLIEERLVEWNKYALAKKYMIYRYQRALLRKSNTTDESILKLVRNENKELAEENSNKNTRLASTQRDYIAGEVSRDVTKRLLLPEKITMAHENGVLHFHDADYFIQPIFNCSLIDIGNMLDYGIVMNGKMIESPKSFQVACIVMTQIIASVASNQYGGQSVAVSHLAKYLRRSREKYERELREEFGEKKDGERNCGWDTREEGSHGCSNLSQKELNRIVELRLRDELRSGVQAIQYQINTLMTTNGQAPFVTLFLQIDPEDEYVDENVMIIREILTQRLKGIKNGQGIPVTPAFPKLVYVLDECNCLKGGPYDEITRLAVYCSAKRMYPDYISAKKMRQNYEGNVFSCMGCRSFLSPWKDESGNYKWEGRFNQGVVSINLPQIGILARGDEEKFWNLLDERLELCREALMCRHKALLGTPSDVSPIHWQYGAIARMNKGEVIDPYLKNGYSTLSLGYIGIYETTYLMKGVSHTDDRGKAFALQVMKYMRAATDQWRRETGLGFSLYGTPAESLCYRFARIDREKYGVIEHVTDKGYYTNSYHVDVRETISLFDKLDFESDFQDISSGGAISYGEIPNMEKNLEALETVVKYIYDHILYAEFNTRSDVCHVCGYEGEIVVNEDMEWECPQCHNKNRSQMSVTRRTCGYLGENFWNDGKTREMKNRVLHL